MDLPVHKKIGQLNLHLFFTHVHAADLAQKALDLTATRLKFHSHNADLSIQNAEKTIFEDESFNHLNCQGVIHHTADTDRAARKICLILKPSNSASISLY